MYLHKHSSLLRFYVISALITSVAFLGSISVAQANEGAAAATHGEKNQGPKAEAHGAAKIGIHQPEFEADKSFAPAKPKLSSPASFTTVTGPVSLKWEAVDLATDYHVQVATDPNFKWIAVEDHFVKGTEFQFAKGEAGKTYWWRVAAVKSDNKATHMKSFFSSAQFTVK